MKIVVLNGSPRPNGNTAKMTKAFFEGASEAGHEITVVPVARMKIAGCLGCEYCHTKGEGKCVQKDDMQELYPLLEEAEMIVFASPIYYHGFSAQLQCAIHRFYAPGSFSKLKKAAMFLTAGEDGVYDGAVFEYNGCFIKYWGLEDMGIFKILEDCDNFDQFREFGESLE
ncbi:MAG: flavodoxin family protein [Firmicutes bacterium]|nr:flavodoxin family protein [Bacillota bacterium]